MQAGPRKPVPPRIRIRKGLEAFAGDSAARRTLGRNELAATVTSEEAMNSRRVEVIGGLLSKPTKWFRNTGLLSLALPSDGGEGIFR